MKFLILYFESFRASLRGIIFFLLILFSKINQEMLFEKNLKSFLKQKLLFFAMVTDLGVKWIIFPTACMECRPLLPKNKMVSSLINPTSEKSTLNNITPLLNNSNLMSALKLRLLMKTYPRHQYPLMIAIIRVLAVVGKRYVCQYIITLHTS